MTTGRINQVAFVGNRNNRRPGIGAPRMHDAERIRMPREVRDFRQVLTNILDPARFSAPKRGEKKPFPKIKLYFFSIYGHAEIEPYQIF
jgi:hypothetical protein